jgi:hypothetical protein
VQTFLPARLLLLQQPDHLHSMSASFIRGFFPHMHAVFQEHAPSLVAMLYPEDVQQQCPTPTMQLGTSWPLSTPSLAPLAVIGICVGLYGCLHLSREPLWRRAFGWFGAMNISAIICHILTLETSRWKPLTRALDVSCTCCSSGFLILASSLHPPHQARRTTLDNSSGKQTGAQPGLVLFDALAIVIMAFAVYSNYHHLPFVNELLYIGTTLAAAALLFLQQVVMAPSPQPGRTWLLAATCCAGLAMQSPLADRHLCRAFGKHVNQVHLLFAACDAAFWCLYQFVKVPGAGAAAGVVGKGPSTAMAAAAGSRLRRKRA